MKALNIGARRKQTVKAAEDPGANLPGRVAEIVVVLNSFASNIQAQSDVNNAITRRLLEQCKQIEQFEERLRVLVAAGALGRPTPVYLGNDVVLARVLGRFKMFLDGKDTAVSCSLILDGYCQEAATETLQSLLNPGMVVVDLGSGPGYFCLVAAGRVQPGGQVHAFEPDPRSFRLLQQNISINGFGGDIADLIHANALDPKEGKFRQKVPERVDVFRIASEYVTPGVFESLSPFLAASPSLAVLADWQPQRLQAAGIEPRNFRRQIDEMGFVVAPIRAPGEVVQIDPEQANDPSRSATLLLKAR